MNTIQWDNRKPKICVPVMEATEDRILQQVETIRAMDIDLVEWRIDAFQQIKDLTRCIELAKMMKERLDGLGLLITCRTKQEGGCLDYADSFYKELYQRICKEQVADLIDLEYDRGKDVFDQLLSIARKNQIQVIASHHDFNKTPSKKEIMEKLNCMRQTDADIIKMACMPRSKEDVFVLMEATAAFKERFPDVVLVTMAMAKEGMPSRILGEFFGSAITFASAGKQSAPGQIDVDTMRFLIDTLHLL